MNDGDWIDYTGFLSTGDCSNFAFGTIETYFGGSIQEIILLQSIYVLTMLEVVEEIPIRYQVPSTTTCNPEFRNLPSSPVFLSWYNGVCKYLYVLTFKSSGKY